MTSAPSAGRLLVNRYALTEVIGNGPASVVWKAWDEELGRDVAVKEIQLPRGLDDLESAVLLKRVLREGREAASFHHPGAVVVHDVFEDAGGVFVVMDLFTGPALSQRVTEGGPLPADAAAALAAQLLDTLEAAHAAGLLHGAVSPQNVVWSEGNPALLSDFAVSGSLIPGRGTGPSPYCAPEQTPTTGGSPAADLWSLGATLRFAVEGDEGVGAKQPAGTMQPLLDALLADDPAARPDVATARRLLPGPIAVTEPAAEAEAEAEADDPAPSADEVQPTTAREPWFFPVPVEVVPGSELRLLDVEPDRPPPPPPRHMSRWRTLGIAVMTAGLSIFMLALLSTQGGRRVRLTTEATTVPAGWFEYTDPETGFSVSRPPDWQVTDLGTATDFRDPRSDATFRVETAAPLEESPHRTWQRVERAFAAHNPDYRRVRLVETTFQERPASIWEYRYNENGQQVQVVQLGLYSGTRPMVLRFQADARDWEDFQPDLAAFEASFRTPR